MDLHGQNQFQKIAIERIAKYSPAKRAFVSDLLGAIGTYYKKDLSEQVTFWIADLIDLDEEDLLKAWDTIRLDETSTYLPQPSKIRRIALQNRRERISYQENMLRGLDDELHAEQMLNAESTKKRMDVIRRIMNREEISYDEMIRVFGERITQEAIKLHEKVKGHYKSWMKPNSQESKSQSIAPKYVTKSFLLTDDTWT